MLIKIGLTMALSGTIASIIFSALFDKGDRYTSPDFNKKWQEVVYFTLCGIAILPFVAAAIVLIIYCYKWIWGI